MLFTADLHLGDETDSVRVDGIRSAKLHDTRERLIEIVDRAAESLQPCSVVIGGDIFDTSSPKPYVVEDFFAVVAHAAKKRVHLVVIPGNHDSSISWTALVVANNYSDYLQVIHAPQFLSIDGISCYVLPHMPKAVEEKLFRELQLPKGDYAALLKQAYEDKPFKVLVTHASLAGCVEAAETEMEAGNAISLIGKSLPRIRLGLIGHIHMHQAIHIREGVDCVYSGSLVPHSFGELEDEKVYVEINKSLEYSFIPFSTPLTREYKHIKINLEKKNFDATDEQLEAKVGGKLLKVTVRVVSRKAVDLQAVKSRIAAFGTILRFEVEETSRLTSLTQSGKKAVHHRGSLQHTKLLEEALKDKAGEYKSEILERALAYGREIILKCSSK